VVEENRLGGTCLNVGCIPTKFYCHAGAGGAAGSWAEVVAQKTKVVDELVRGVELLFEKRGVKLFRGRGRLTPDGDIVVAGPDAAVLRARRGVLYGPGSVASTVPGLAVDHVRVLDSDDLVDSPLDFPSLIVVGGGAIGLEWATIARRRGLRVTVLEMMPHLLPGLDEDVAKRLAGLLRRRGMEVLTGQKAEQVTPGAEGVRLNVGGREVEAARVLVAVGRRAHVDAEELEGAGVALDHGRIKVTAGMATTRPGVWAAGDAAAGGPMLAHLATRQGLVAAENILGGDEVVDYDRVPWAVFADPEAAGVGLNAAQAAARGVAAREGRVDYRALGRPRADGNVDGFFKILAREGDGRLLGAHALGFNAAEIIQIATAALSCGADVRTLASFVAVHPTYGELVAEAAEDWLGLATHKI